MEHEGCDTQSQRHIAISIWSLYRFWKYLSTLCCMQEIRRLDFATRSRGEGKNMTNNDILMLLAGNNIRYYCLCESAENCKGCINFDEFFDEFLLLYLFFVRSFRSILR